MRDEPTDQDLIVGHPFQSTGQWGDSCEWVDANGWMCGYSRAEHGDRPGDATYAPRPGGIGGDA